MSTSAEAGPNIRRLWIVVIGLGLLILVAFAVVVTTIASRLSGMGAPAIGDKPIMLPSGARVLDMAAAGDRIVLRLGLADGRERLLFLDARTGEPVGGRELQTTR